MFRNKTAKATSHKLSLGLNNKPKGIKTGVALSDAFEDRFNMLKSRGNVCVYFDTIENIINNLSVDDHVTPIEASKKAIHVAFVFDDYHVVDILATKEFRVSNLLDDWAKALVQSMINFGKFIDVGEIKSEYDHDHYHVRVELTKDELIRK